MKNLEIEWTLFSKWCLDEIHKYIYSQSNSKRIADAFVLKLISAVDSLSRFPKLGQIEPLLKLANKEYRYIIVSEYKIIYRVKKELILITDVFHVKQNPVKITYPKKKRN